MRSSLVATLLHLLDVFPVLFDTTIQQVQSVIRKNIINVHSKTAYLNDAIRLQLRSNVFIRQSKVAQSPKAILLHSIIESKSITSNIIKLKLFLLG